MHRKLNSKLFLIWKDWSSAKKFTNIIQINKIENLKSLSGS